MSRKDGYYWCTTYVLPPPTRPRPVGGITGKLQRRAWVRAYNAWLETAEPFITDSRGGAWPGGSFCGLRVIAGPLKPPKMSIKVDWEHQ